MDLKVKNYCELPMVERDPATALVIEDGRVDCIKMDDYEGLRSLAEVLALAVPACEIRELNSIAGRLGLSRVRVLRVTDDAGFTGVLSPDDYDCLEEIGVTLFAMCEDDDYAHEHDNDAVDKDAELADQFIGLATLNRTSGSARWQQLAYYTIAVRQCKLPFKMPPWLKSEEAMLIADDRPWWGFPQAASTRQARAFADYIAEHCSEPDYFPGVLHSAWNWLTVHGEEYGEFAQMFQAFRAARPLEPWAKLTALPDEHSRRV